MADSSVGKSWLIFCYNSKVIKTDLSSDNIAGGIFTFDLLKIIFKYAMSPKKARVVSVKLTQVLLKFTGAAPAFGHTPI